MVDLVPFLSYLAGFKSISVPPSAPDTMTNAALEAAASPSGNMAEKSATALSLQKHVLLDRQYTPTDMYMYTVRYDKPVHDHGVEGRFAVLVWLSTESNGVRTFPRIQFTVFGSGDDCINCRAAARFTSESIPRWQQIQ